MISEDSSEDFGRHAGSFRVFGGSTALRRKAWSRTERVFTTEFSQRQVLYHNELTKPSSEGVCKQIDLIKHQYGNSNVVTLVLNT